MVRGHSLLASAHRSWEEAGDALRDPQRFGGTDLVHLHDEETGTDVFAKLELTLPSGSTKDRVAAHIVGSAMCGGLVRPGDRIVEASSGSTSISLAMVCASAGLRFLAVMPENVSPERVLLIERYGGEIELTPAGAGLRGALERVDEIARATGAFPARQFANPLNVAAHRRGTGPELLAQLARPLDAFVAGIGTGGTLMGVALALRDAGVETRIARAMPATGALCGGNPEVSSAIPGVVDGFSELLEPGTVAPEDVVVVEDAAALAAARRLCAWGLPVGPSSGLNFEAALRLGRRLGPGAAIGTVFCDRIERYFSTALFDDLPPTGPRGRRRAQTNACWEGPRGRGTRR